MAETLPVEDGGEVVKDPIGGGGEVVDDPIVTTPPFTAEQEARILALIDAAFLAFRTTVETMIASALQTFEEQLPEPDPGLSMEQIAEVEERVKKVFDPIFAPQIREKTAVELSKVKAVPTAEIFERGTGTKVLVNRSEKEAWIKTGLYAATALEAVKES